MNLVAFADSRPAGRINFDCLCLGPIVGAGPVRLELDASSDFVKRYGLLLAVADSTPDDGIKPASQLFMEELVSRFYSWSRKDIDPEVTRQAIGTLIDEAADSTVSRLADEERVGVCTTFAGVALLDPDVAVVFHQGDCRVLRESSGFLRQMTNDHAEEKTKLRPKKEASVMAPLEFELTRFLGILGAGYPDIRMVNWGPGDIFLAGTPGWHGNTQGIAFDAIKTGLFAYVDPGEFVSRSLNEALRGDNRTDASLATVRIL